MHAAGLNLDAAAERRPRSLRVVGVQTIFVCLRRTGLRHESAEFCVTTDGNSENDGPVIKMRQTNGREREGQKRTEKHELNQERKEGRKKQG